MTNFAKEKPLSYQLEEKIIGIALIYLAPLCFKILKKKLENTKEREVLQKPRKNFIIWKILCEFQQYNTTFMGKFPWSIA